MKSDKVKLDLHLFVCTQKKEKGDCCANKNATKLRDDVKALSAELFKDSGVKIRINSSGCLGRCSEGITSVLYPKQEWCVGLNENSTEELLDLIRSELKNKTY